MATEEIEYDLPIRVTHVVERSKGSLVAKITTDGVTDHTVWARERKRNGRAITDIVPPITGRGIPLRIKTMEDRTGIIDAITFRRKV